jgi:hypothetical protein
MQFDGKSMCSDVSGRAPGVLAAHRNAQGMRDFSAVNTRERLLSSDASEL